jgi:pyrimidine deaminase RibD-like protein
MMAETKMPPAKETQVKAILEQVVRACKENNDVVAQAGLEQVRAIIEEQKKASL